MNRELVQKIYDTSVTQCIQDDNVTPAWTWEENMVKNTILELKYTLSVNRAALTMDQLTILNNVFGTEF